MKGKGVPRGCLLSFLACGRGAEDGKEGLLLVLRRWSVERRNVIP